jgi:hypothetical protein
LWNNQLCKKKIFSNPKYEPDLLDYDSLDKSAGYPNIEKAFQILEKLDIEVSFIHFKTFKTYVDPQDAGKEQKTMMMCLGKIYEHFHTEKYFDKNQFSILTDFPSTQEKVDSPKVTTVTKEVEPKIDTSSTTQEKPVKVTVKEVKPKEEYDNSTELLPKILAELEEMKRKYQLEVEKTKSLTEKYHKLQEEKVKKVYGSMQYIILITFLVCVLAYFFK